MLRVWHLLVGHGPWRFYCRDCERHPRHAWPSSARWYCVCGKPR